MGHCLHRGHATRRSSAFIKVKQRHADSVPKADRCSHRRTPVQGSAFARQQLLLDHNPPTRELFRMRHPLRKRSAISVPATCARRRPCCDCT